MLDMQISEFLDQIKKLIRDHKTIIITLDSIVTDL